jgi:hypothetical protein
MPLYIQLNILLKCYIGKYDAVKNFADFSEGLAESKIKDLLRNSRRMGQFSSC